MFNITIRICLALVMTAALGAVLVPASANAGACKQSEDRSKAEQGHIVVINRTPSRITGTFSHTVATRVSKKGWILLSDRNDKGPYDIEPGQKFEQRFRIKGTAGSDNIIAAVIKTKNAWSVECNFVFSQKKKSSQWLESQCDWVEPCAKCTITCDKGFNANDNVWTTRFAISSK